MLLTEYEVLYLLQIKLFHVNSLLPGALGVIVFVAAFFFALDAGPCLTGVTD